MRFRRILLLFTLFFPLSIAFSQDAPRWITNKDTVFPPATYISGLGEGKSAAEARDRALMQISMYFNTTIQAQTDLLVTYQETTQNGKTGFTENTSVTESALINTQADFFGVTFEAPYTNRRGTVYVLAKINRAEALAIYDSRIQNAMALTNDILAKNETSSNPYAAVKKLREARSLAELAAGYASMAVLINSASAARYATIPAINSRITNAIEHNRKDMTVTITLNDKRTNSLALATTHILREEGFLLIDSGGTYDAVIHITLNEQKTQNYNTVQPLVDITFRLQNGRPLVRFQKEYPVFRHTNLNDAIGRALRNIEQDFTEDFINQLRRIEE